VNTKWITLYMLTQKKTNWKNSLPDKTHDHPRRDGSQAAARAGAARGLLIFYPQQWEGLVQAKAVVTKVFNSEKLSEEESCRGWKRTRLIYS